MRSAAALVVAAAVAGLASTPAAAEVSTKAPRATLVQVLRGGKQALILDRVSGEYGVVKVGDTIHGLRVAEIEPDQIVLATPTPPERYFVLPLVESAAPGAAAVAPPAGGAADVAANPRAPASPGGDVAVAPDRLPPANDPTEPGPATPGRAEPQPDVVMPDDLAAGAPDGAEGSSGGDVLDPYGPPAGSGDIPSIVAPPASRAEPAMPAPRAEARPDVRPDVRTDVRPEPRPPADVEVEGDAVEPGDLDDEGIDADLPADLPAEPVAPPRSDPKVTTVEPTEVQPRASAKAGARPEEPARPLSRRELDWALSDFAALSRQIQIERAREGGVRIVAVERSSFLAKLGIERGDVVKRVAGHPIDTVDQAAAAYAALADARDVVVELERRGKPLRLKYRLTR